MRILGIDPGLDVTGYGLLNSKNSRPYVIEAGIIRTPQKQALSKRLNVLYAQMSRLIEQTKPSACIVEKVYSHYKHPMTAVLMGHARGVLLFACSQKGVEVVDYPAKTVKRSVTGNGNASKLQVQRVVAKVLSLGDKEMPADVTDALALCLTHIHHAKKEFLKYIS